ncbi:MAG TPA: LLM class flavin-dependent oxidoreductase [Candidatus Binataceae bacterium]|nr:LLM class flavin-dependent oxidoreductase [Candidatus Binataceae bacterium]
MARKLTIGINWQGKLDFKAVIERAKLADEAGIHSIWVAEAWGRDAFTLLTLLAEHTKKVQLGTSIVNIYSRTPAALAQHFGTLDELSGGRMIIGLGTSGPQVIEHFHGVKFNPPLTRLREYVDIINTLMAGTPLNYEGKVFSLKRGFTLRFEPPRKHIPIFIASLNKNSVEFTAKKADGWLPVMIPLSGLKSAISEFRGIASAAGRDPRAVEVKAPGAIVVTSNPDRARVAQAANVAFYAARMGTFYSEQLTRFGFGEEVKKIRAAFDSGGSKAGTEAVSPKMLSELGFVGDVAGARERLKAHEEAGADMHAVEIDAPDAASFAKTVAALLA